jgi:hypothetical protein
MTTPQPPISNIQLPTLMPIGCSQIFHLNPMLWSPQKIGRVKRRVEKVDVNINLKKLDEEIIPNIHPHHLLTDLWSPLCVHHIRETMHHIILIKEGTITS